MSVFKDKYRGTTGYFHVTAELVRAAQYRGVTTYQDIAVIMGLPLSGSHMAKEVGQVLGEISEDEVTAGRPMLSVGGCRKRKNRTRFLRRRTQAGPSGGRPGQVGLLQGRARCVVQGVETSAPEG
jgi:alkylated DNA nucleotide flippase Atl1